MTKNELVARAKELGITGYSSLNKAQLQDIITNYESNPEFGAQPDELDHDDVMAQDANSLEPVTVATEPLSDFVIRSVEDDNKILAKIMLERKQSEYDFLATSKQVNYLKLLECNFKVRIDMTQITSDILACEKAIEIHNAIRTGKVSRRTQNESKARYRAMKVAQYQSQAHREAAMTSSIQTIDKTNINAQRVAESVIKASDALQPMLVDENYSSNPVVAFIKRLLNVK